MQLCRLIAPEWAVNKGLKKVLEGEFSNDQIKHYNSQGYNVYYLPNGPSSYEPGTILDGSRIDKFEYIFVDFDLKNKAYSSKEEFVSILDSINLPTTKIVDSGNGVHAYWYVTDLDAKSYLRFQKRLCGLLDTDPATTMLFQLMRLPGTINTKIEAEPKECTILSESDAKYTAEELDNFLPPITAEDERVCIEHYDRIVNKDSLLLQIDEEIPPKFGKLLRSNSEVKELWSAPTDDRSKSDFRLGHLMFANGFTKEEAASVLVNSAKALQRAPIHRISYAENIISKIWTFELAEDKDVLSLSSSVREILQKAGDTIKGTRFKCHPCVDNTAHGFRLGQVIGLVAGSGVGKTAFALNMYRWFAQENPDYYHFFIPLEQPANEIADRWKTMSGNDISLHDKVHVISNYNDDGSFRHLSFDDIKEYILKFQEVKKIKIGCVVIDHIGALKKKGKDGENQDLMDICHSMKSFAVETNTMLIMQSQAPREKAGIGDLELNKDAAYGTVYFESYCDYLITLWQPLKRCHADAACPTVTAFKFCKIRHKKAKRDTIKEDVPYYLSFDSESELMCDMTQDEETSFKYFISQATNKRKADRKTDILTYQSVPYKDGGTNAIISDKNSTRH